MRLMSLRFPSSFFSSRCALGKKAVAVSALIIALGLGAYGTAIAATKNTDQDPRLAPPVQNYADQALPVGAGDGYYDSPLKAGTLTLQDVLEAHKPASNSDGLPAPGGAPVPAATTTAPLLSPAQSSSTSLMMSQGMRSVLQKVGETSVSTPSRMRAPSLNGQQPAAAEAQGQPASLVSGLAAVPASATPAPATTVPIAVTPDGAKYQPGQAPKNLAQELAGTSVPLTSAAPSAPTAAESTASAASAKAASTSQSCDPDVQKWEKSCGEAGYPATYIGKIVGETHTGCADNSLHDVWVSNSCAPPDASTAQTASTDAVCGIASNNEFDDAPTSNLCAQGIASTVSGSGPWTWACSGVNGGQAAACAAHTRVSKTDGECGGANGVATSIEPSADLCASGSAAPVKGSGPWKWSCRGVGGGSTQSCIAPVAAAGASAPAVRNEQASPVAEEASAPASTPSASTASADKGELCGEASETLAYEAPDKDLCRVGTASVVNGDGPWTWSCTDNEGRSSSCRTLSLGGESEASAPQAAVAASHEASAPSSGSPRLQPEHTLPDHPVRAEAPVVSHDLACGLAASTPTVESPSDELCVNGKASAVRGSGPWHWTCSNKAHHKVSCETPKMADGACGAANGAVLKSAPFAGLCSAGTPTGIEGDGPWTWTCTGRGGGVNVSCGAALQSGVSGKVEGACGPAARTTRPDAPVSGLCSSGAPSAVNGSGPWNWSCSGFNGGGVSSCSANKVAETQAPGPSVNGLCGAANGVLTTSKPVDGLCSSGSVAAIVGSGPWNWSCLGENGGMTVSCTAPLEPPAPIDGECGGASGVPTLVKPQSGLCSSGLTGVVSGRGPWTWTCSGANGGSPASCVAPVAGKTGAMPSVSRAAPVLESVDAGVSAASQGLVTPHLPPSNGSLPIYDKKVLPSLSSTAIAPPPAVVTIAGPDVPDATPELAMGVEPVAPPAIRSQLSSAPALQETAGERAARIPGNHLTLDPTISTVLFTRGSGNIDDGVLSNIDRLANVLAANPDVRVTLTAYADNDGSTPRDARRLSLTRALAVRAYLESKGVAESRVDVRAEGANSTSGYIDRVDVKVND
jgi:outer membrane protein OmpA-like peptidoglycan-associated protein